VKRDNSEYEKLKKEILIRDGYRCRLCLSFCNLDVDHIKKRSQGGSDTPDNLRTLCRACHDREDNSTNSSKLTPKTQLYRESEGVQKQG
jgi:5-methylcytosine-specific restriction endonuclease McrA